MAKLSRRLPDNVPGEFFVDDTCIDCDTCRVVAPAHFGEGEQSFVMRQPADAPQRRRALLALVACPVSAIGTVHKLPAAETRVAASAFPEPIEDEVHFAGYAAESSFGAQSYLIVRPDGNVLVDSPRAARPLLARIESLGGVRTLFLTHRDDVADHRVFRDRFACERVLHRDDRTSATSDLERFLVGDEPTQLGPELLAIPVPGHTRGSVALLLRERFLFTGDHLWGTVDGRLAMGRRVCWYSWREQVRSLERLLDHRFEWVLPGHGRRYRANSAAAMRAEVERLLGDVSRR